MVASDRLTIETELYLRESERLEAMNAPFGAAMLAAARLQPGEYVLDIGCGTGSTTIEAARRVAPGGKSVGVDISAALIDSARESATTAGVHNIEFLHADAQLYPFQEAMFDAVISRFGIMFFEDPEKAFAHLGRAARPDGRLVVVCPRGPLESEWVSVAFAAAAAHVGLPDVGSPGGPGPFAFADSADLERAIRAGGFDEVAIDAITLPVRIGVDVEDVVSFITSLPESRQLFAGTPEEKVAGAINALREGFAPYARPEGIMVSDSSWLASARR
jgi:SAM-dependent methyltransferase